MAISHTKTQTSTRSGGGRTLRQKPCRKVRTGITRNYDGKEGDGSEKAEGDGTAGADVGCEAVSGARSSTSEVRYLGNPGLLLNGQ